MLFKYDKANKRFDVVLEKLKAIREYYGFSRKGQEKVFFFIIEEAQYTTGIKKQINDFITKNLTKWMN